MREPVPVPDREPGQEPPKLKKSHRKKPGARSYKHSGYYSLHRRVQTVGLDQALDGRTQTAKDLFAWMTRLTEHLGGADQITPPQEALVTRSAIAEVLLRQLESALLNDGAIRQTENGIKENNLVEPFRQLSRLQIDLLRTLGIQRQVRDALDLDAIRRVHAEIRVENEEKERARKEQQDSDCN